MDYQLFKVLALTNDSFHTLATFITERASQKHLEVILANWRDDVGLREEEVDYVISDLALEESQAVIKELFQNAKQKFCAFHVGQAFEKNYHKLNGDAKMYAQALRAIHDPTKYSVNKLIDLVDAAPSSDAFANYLRDYYVGTNAKWNPETWARYNFVGLPNLWGVPGTNNGIERHWCKLKTWHKELRLGKTTVQRCVEILMMSMAKDDRLLYQSNIEMDGRTHENLHPFFEFRRPDYYLSYVRDNLRVICDAKNNNSEGFVNKEAGAEDADLEENERGFLVTCGPTADPELVIISNNTISCSGSGDNCTGFFSRGVPCIHLIQLIIFGTITVSDLPQFYLNISTHKPCQAIIDTHVKNGTIPTDWVANAIKNLSDSDETDTDSIFSSSDFDTKSVSSQTRKSVKKPQIKLIDNGWETMCAQKKADLKILQTVERNLHEFILKAPQQSAADVNKVTLLMTPLVPMLKTAIGARNNNAKRDLDLVIYETTGGKVKFDVTNFGECKKRPKKSDMKKQKSKINLRLGETYAYTIPDSDKIQIGDLFEIPHFNDIQNIMLVMKNYKEVPYDPKKTEKDFYRPLYKSTTINYNQIIPITVVAEMKIAANSKDGSKYGYKIKNMAAIRKRMKHVENGNLEPSMPDSVTDYLNDVSTDNFHSIPAVTDKIKSDFENFVKKFGAEQKKLDDLNLCQHKYYNYRVKRNYSWDKAQRDARSSPFKFEIGYSTLKALTKSSTEHLLTSTCDTVIATILDIVNDKRKVCLDLSLSEYVNTNGKYSIVNMSERRRPATRRNKNSDSISDDEFCENFFNYDFLHQYFRSAHVLSSELKDIAAVGGPMASFLFEKRRLIDFANVDIICIPIHISLGGRNGHYVLAWIDMKNQMIGYVDRLSTLSLERNEQTKSYTEHLWTYGLLCYLDSIYLIDNEPQFNFKKFKIKIFGKQSFPNNEQQRDGHSCGIIMMTQIYMLLSQKDTTDMPLHLPFSRQKFSNCRQQLGALVYKYIADNKFQDRVCDPVNPDDYEEDGEGNMVDRRNE